MNLTQSKGVAVNTFNDGLVMDANPLVTPSSNLVNCLNGTLVTFNGNENVLQNDMGNGRVETASLPNGYIPVGTCSFGGIIYIVSYNPDKDLCQIGCFPSPERNITSSELNDTDKTISNSDFVYTKTVFGQDLTYIKTALSKVELSDRIIFNPGDKFKVFFGNAPSAESDYSTITDYGNTVHEIGKNPKYIRIHVVGVNDNSITYLDNGLKWFNIDPASSQLPVSDNTPAYFIAPYANDVVGTGQEKVNLDQYRSLVTTPYNIFKARTCGKLALFFELEVIDTFSYTWECKAIDDPVNDGEENEEELMQYNLLFTFDYTSSHPDIRPKYVFMTQNDLNNLGHFSDGGTGDLQYFELCQNEDDTGESPSQSIQLEQRFKICIQADKDIERVWKYELTPSMEFGLIDYLSINDQINFNAIDSGEVDIPIWKYYSNTSTETSAGSLLLTFQSDIYPKPQEEVERIILRFIPFTYYKPVPESTDSTTESTDSTTEEELSYKNDGIATYTIQDKNSYSGVFNIQIPYEGRVTNLTGTIHENYFYIVEIIYKYKSKSEGFEVSDKYFYKCIWTCPVFNKAYTGKAVNDFTQLYLGNYLSIYPSVQKNDTVRVSLHNTEETLLADLYTDDRNSYDSYKATNIYDVSGDISVIIDTLFENDYNTFYINRSTISDKNLDTNSIEIINDNSEYLSIGEQQSNQISSLPNYNEELTEVTLNNTEGNTITCNIRSQLYRYAQYLVDSNYPVSTNNTLLPLIYNDDDLYNFGMQRNNNNFIFTTVGTMTHTDESGRKAGLVLGTAQYSNNDYVRTSLKYGCPGSNDNYNEYYIGSNSYNSQPGKALSKFETIEQPIVGLDDAINGICNIVGSPIVAFLYTGYREKDQRLKDVQINWKYVFSSNTYLDNSGHHESSSIFYSLYMKDQSGNYLPINQSNSVNFSRGITINGLRTLIIFLRQLYKKSDQDLTIAAGKVLGLLYKDPSSSIAKFSCTFNISVNENSDVYIKSIEGDEYTLQDIQELMSADRDDIRMPINLSLNNLDIKGEDINGQKSSSLFRTGNVVDITQGIWLDDSAYINGKQKMMNPSIDGAVLINPGDIKESNITFKKDKLYYISSIENNLAIVSELDSNYNPVGGNLTYDDNGYYIFTPNSVTISSQNYMISKSIGLKSGELCLTNTGGQTMCLAITDTAGHTAAIGRIPDIRLVKDLDKTL